MLSLVNETKFHKQNIYSQNILDLYQHCVYNNACDILSLFPLAPGMTQKYKDSLSIWKEETMKSFMANSATVERKWFVVDADGKTLGRLAVEVAKILRGKHKPTFTPHVDCGDHVIIVNAEKIKTTGNKLLQKTYFRHSGYVGGTTFVTLGKMLATHPGRVVEMAVKGMLPKNTLGRQMYRKLNVYVGPNHPHQAQQPEELTLNIR